MVEQMDLEHFGSCTLLENVRKHVRRRSASTRYPV
jgi:hypothetical protein